jgi:chromosome segregation ATPase
LRRQVATLAGQVERRDRTITKLEGQLRSLERIAATLEAERDDLRRRLDRLVEQMNAARRTSAPAPMIVQAPLPPAVGNRAVRRAAARRERKQR